LASSYDIVLDDNAFTNASSDVKDLKNRTEALKTKLKQMYIDLKTAMDTPAGNAVETTAESVLIKPIEDMLIVIEHVSVTLTDIIGTGHYKDVFIKFEDLNSNVKF
jgi:hypothetical protein